MACRINRRALADQSGSMAGSKVLLLALNWVGSGMPCLLLALNWVGSGMPCLLLISVDCRCCHHVKLLFQF